jgi:hypothetical protein
MHFMPHEPYWLRPCERHKHHRGWAFETFNKLRSRPYHGQCLLRPHLVTDMMQSGPSRSCSISTLPLLRSMA